MGKHAESSGVWEYAPPGNFEVYSETAFGSFLVLL